jgi:hypothetical protein
LGVLALKEEAVEDEETEVAVDMDVEIVEPALQ